MVSSPSHETDTNEESQSKQEVLGKRRSLRRFLRPSYVLFAFVFFIISTLMAGYGHYTDPGPLSESKFVMIPHGGVKKVATVLQENGILSSGRISSFFFQLVVKITAREGVLQAAEFSFPQRVSIAHSLEILRHGKAVSHNITIAEGLTASQIEKVFQETPFLEGILPSMTEGTVFPQTFSYQRGTKRSVLLKRMQDLMSVTLQKVWNNRDKGALEGLVKTPQELVVLASLIERETSIEAERPRVARVFLNRLRKGMKLQTDPTVIYALTGGKNNLDHPLTHADLQIDNPYNTYQITGLPPGPICSPGLSSLEAAAHPAEGDELYFVATGQGGHNFARTLGEQTQHIKAYRRVLNASPQ